MKAEKIFDINATEAAPRGWAFLPEVLDERPNPLLSEISLQKAPGSNMCMWFTDFGDGWEPYGHPFTIIDDGGGK